MEIKSIKQGLQWEGTHYCSTPPTEADSSTNTRQVPRGVVEVAVRFLQLAPIQERRTSLGVASSGLTRYRVCCSSTCRRREPRPGGESVLYQQAPIATRSPSIH